MLLLRSQSSRWGFGDDAVGAVRCAREEIGVGSSCAWDICAGCRCVRLWDIFVESPAVGFGVEAGVVLYSSTVGFCSGGRRDSAAASVEGVDHTFYLVFIGRGCRTLL